MFRKPTWCCWKSVGLADQFLFCAQAGLPRDPETWDPGRDWRSMILQNQLHTIETLRKILRKIGNSTSSEKWPCSSLLGFPNSSPVVQTSTSETEHLSDVRNCESPSVTMWIWQIRTPKGQQKNISMIGVKNDKCTCICSKGRNWMKISPASCKLCSQTRRLINARYLSMQTRGCTLKVVALKSQIFTLVYSKMTKYVPNPKSSIENTITILQAVLCAAWTGVWSMNHTPVAFTSTVAICTNIQSLSTTYICPYAYIRWYLYPGYPRC